MRCELSRAELGYEWGIRAVVDDIPLLFFADLAS
jgi:hypothetical protein